MTTPHCVAATGTLRRFVSLFPMRLFLILALAAVPGRPAPDPTVYDLFPGFPVRTWLNSSVSPGSEFPCRYEFRVPRPPGDVHAVRVSVTSDFSRTVPYRDPTDPERMTQYDTLLEVTGRLESPNDDPALSIGADAFRGEGSRDAVHMVVSAPRANYTRGSAWERAWWGTSAVLVTVGNCGMTWPRAGSGRAPIVDVIAGPIVAEVEYVTGGAPVPQRNAAIVATPHVVKIDEVIRYAGYCLNFVLPSPCNNLNATMYFRELTGAVSYEDTGLLTLGSVRNASIATPIEFKSAAQEQAFFANIALVCKTYPELPIMAMCIQVDLGVEALRPLGVTIEYVNNVTGEASLYGAVTMSPAAFGKSFDPRIVNGDTPPAGSNGFPVVNSGDKDGVTAPIIRDSEFPRFAIVLLVFTFFFAALFVVFACLRGRSNAPGEDDGGEGGYNVDGEGSVPHLARAIVPDAAPFSTVEIRLPPKRATPSQKVVTPMSGEVDAAGRANDFAGALGGGSSSSGEGSSDESSSAGDAVQDKRFPGSNAAV